MNHSPLATTLRVSAEVSMWNGKTLKNVLRPLRSRMGLETTQGSIVQAAQ